MFKAHQAVALINMASDAKGASMPVHTYTAEVNSMTQLPRSMLSIDPIEKLDERKSTSNESLARAPAGCDN